MKDLIWYQRSDQRLSAWREFRLNLDQLSLETALQEVCTLWSFAPYVTYYLDPAKPQEWPDPWQLLSDDIYCTLARGLGILYTIALADRKDIKDAVLIEIEGDNLVLVNQSKYILNWEPDTIVNINLGPKNPRHCVSLEQIKQQIK